MEDNVMDRKDLKIQALLDLNARLTSEFTDLRVEYTVLSNEYTKVLEELNANVEEKEETNSE